MLLCSKFKADRLNENLIAVGYAGINFGFRFPEMFQQARNFFHRVRKAAHEVSPAYEDSGLFKTDPCQIVVELIPQMRRNDRGDLIVRGFVDRKNEVDVFFAGRRTKEAGQLDMALRYELKFARATAAAAGQKTPPIERIRMAVRIEGAWRRRTQRDDNGWESSTFHFVAARWSFIDPHGNTVSFGEPPLR